MKRRTVHQNQVVDAQILDCDEPHQTGVLTSRITTGDIALAIYSPGVCAGIDFDIISILDHEGVSTE